MVVNIVDPSTAWPGEFARIAAVLRAALGPRALRIDHIGSTAVPGLAAKDVIDVQVTVTALSSDVSAAIAGAGFVRHRFGRDHVPPGRTAAPGDWEKILFTEPPGSRRTNVHVRQAGRPNQRFALLFRDYLVAHPDAAAAYAELKRRLAAALADPESYPEVKDPAVDLIQIAAEAWAGSVGWDPSIAATAPGGHGMTIRLTRLSNDRHRLSVVRSNGTAVERELETRSVLLHDLVHYAVEGELGRHDGFWGTLAAGLDFDALLAEAAAPSRPGILLAESLVGPMQSVWRHGLDADRYVETVSEFAVAIDREWVERVRERIRRLWGQWQGTPFHETMELPWPPVR